MNLDLPPDVVAHATGELVDLYYKRRPLAAAKADILVRKTRATLRRLQTDEHERAVHAAIISGTVVPLVVARENRVLRSGGRSAEVIQFKRKAS
jgi:hypothetical protein